MLEEGYVHDVRLITLGSFLDGDHLTGSTTLKVMDASDFNEVGGSFSLNGQILTYVSADIDNDTITLTSALASDGLNGDRLDIYPTSVEKQAVVVVDGFDEALTAIVPHGLHDRLAEGIREEFNRESVTVSLEGNIWYVDNVFGIAPIIDGQYLENVVADDIIDGIVTEVKLANEAVTAAKIAANAVTETKIANDSVSTPKLIAGSVVADKLAADSVNSSKIVSGAVTTAKLDALAVTADKIAANAITATKIAANSIDTSKLAVGMTRNAIADPNLLETTLSSARLANANTSTNTATALLWELPGSSVARLKPVTAITQSFGRFGLHGSAALSPNYTTGTAIPSALSGYSIDQGLGSVKGSYQVSVYMVNGTAWPVSQNVKVTMYARFYGADGTSLTTSTMVSERVYTAATSGFVVNQSVSGAAIPAGAVSFIPYFRVEINNAVTDLRVDLKSFLASQGVNSVLIEDGAITADKLDAAAITGKTITGGTITGALIRTAASGERIVLDSATNTMAVYDVDGNNLVVNAASLVANDSSANEILKLDHEGLKLYNHAGFGGGGTIEFIPDGFSSSAFLEFDAHGLGWYTGIGFRTAEYAAFDGFAHLNLYSYAPSQNTDPELLVHSTQDRPMSFKLDGVDQGRGVVSYINTTAHSGTVTTLEIAHVTTPYITWRPGRAYRITYHYQGTSSVGGDTVGFRIRRQNTSGNSLFDSLRSHKGTNANDIVNGESSQIVYNSGTTDISAPIVGTVYRSLGTGTVYGYANVANPVWLMVEDIGLASDYPGLKAL